VTTLTALGIASLLFVAWFTARAYRNDISVDGKQTRRQAIVEVWVGIVIGFFLNWTLNWLLLPMVGAKFTAMENFWLGCVYTAVSVMRGYAIRRWAERDIRRFSAWISERIAA
jgi:high-affinity Fe2+/Pb2+ permease